MDGKVRNICIGAAAMRTCMGDKAQTLSALRESGSALCFDERYAMCTGRADVKRYDGYTRFESLLMEQIEAVGREAELSFADEDIRLVVATTKGNVEGLAKGLSDRVFLYDSALAVAGYFGFVHPPVVVSNACISGVSAFVVAKDLLERGLCRHVLVAGGDVLSEFVAAGFASFKSVSSKPCVPYDAKRDGLTLGEGAGAVLLTSEEGGCAGEPVYLRGGAISNDANHISGPSRTGDGLYFAIDAALSEAGVDAEDVGFVNAHGTATRFNDEMESKALAWAGLCRKPLNSFKGNIGHTLGASGVVETILCAEQLRQGYIFGTKGYVSSDTSHELKVSSEPQGFVKKCCVKTASGFGGCNAALVLDMEKRAVREEMPSREAALAAEYVLPQSSLPFAEFIRAQYRTLGESNMKFYKMSDMSKALYVAVEHLLETENIEDVKPRRRAIVLANRASSLDADIAHQEIIDKRLPEGASPAVFVYTLPNVSAGEVCIRHEIRGENTFFIENEDSGMVEDYARSMVENNRADAVIYGRCDYLQGKWNVCIKLLKVK